MNRLFFSLLVIASVSVQAQPPDTANRRTGSGPPRSSQQADRNDKTIPNPFTAPDPTASMMGAGMEMDMEMDMGMGTDDMAMMAGGMDAAGMYGGMMGMGAYQPDPEQQFRRGLQRAITALGKADGEEEREVLRGYIRQALQKRYLELIAGRQRELDKLKQSVAKLESDLKRRESAKDRVIEVQMQSVQLAAEGLMQLGELSGDSGGDGGDYGSSGYDVGYEMGGLGPP